MVYKITIFLLRIMLRLRFRVRIEGLEHIPEGAVILAMNHTSNFDPLLVGAHTPRKMNVMGKEELFTFKPFAWYLRQVGCFPVKRGQADIKSLKTTLRLLKEGNIFAIFIEGTRSKTEEMREVKKGIGFIASKSKSPIVPTYIYGAKRKWFGTAGVVFGEPVLFEEGLGHEEIANRVGEEIKKLGWRKQG